jgi:uncharacterized tellurite resistance protein B-like protein
MSMLEWFRARGFGREGSPAGEQGDTETVMRIVRELDKLDAKRARHLAAFAYVLSRVANADLEISDVETARMIDLVGRLGQLSESQATLVVEIAKSQNRLCGGTEDYLVTREFKAIASDQERCELLECLFAVSAADGDVSAEEEAQIWQIASELGFTREEFVQIRLGYSRKRTVFRRDA